MFESMQQCHSSAFQAKTVFCLFPHKNFSTKLWYQVFEKSQLMFSLENLAAISRIPPRRKPSKLTFDMGELGKKAAHQEKSSTTKVSSEVYTLQVHLLARRHTLTSDRRSLLPKQG